MKEEDIDKRIERVIESVGSKKAAMRQWEAERLSNELKRNIAAKRWRVYGIPAAASIVVVLGIGLGFFMNRGGESNYGVESTSAPIYRGGSCDVSEIQTMIDSTHFDEALQAIDTTMADTVIDPSFTPERREYLHSVNDNRNYELNWLKIGILVKKQKTDEAVALLKEYVKSDGVHQDEAKELLRTLSR